jgi:surface protein
MIAAIHGIVDSGKSDRGPIIMDWQTFRYTGDTVNWVKLPYVAGGTYSGVIDWGDGSTSINSYSNRGHTYGASGTYTVTITGQSIGWNLTAFNYPGEPYDLELLQKQRQSLKKLKRWGNLRPGKLIPLGRTNDGDYYRLFYFCQNLNMSDVEDLPDFTETTRISGMFSLCSSLTTVNRLTEWNMNQIIDVSSMFSACVNFNQNLSAWNFQNIKNADSLFASCSLFNNGGSTGISSWNVSENEFFSNMFNSCSIFNHDLSSWDMSSALAIDGMFSGATLFNNGGATGIGDWNVSLVQNMGFVFVGTPFNQDISSWDVSSVQTMQGMFVGAASFNNGGSTGIGNWAIHNVNNMGSMFSSATSFNQPIENWDFSSHVITDMQSMFGGTQFNRDISSWDVSSVTNMSSMFTGNNQFNQDISSWDVSSVIDMSYMFRSADAFNQDISSWDVSNVSNFEGMFYQNSAFNQDISAWPIGSTATSIIAMFADSAFNNGGATGIGAWDVSAIQSMSSTFSYSPFNQPIGTWDPSSVTDMSAMFLGASAFNQSLSQWGSNTISVGTMANMFEGAISFNQDISAWDVSSVSDMTRMFLGASAFNNGGAAGIGSWNTAGLGLLNNTFSNASSFNQSLGGWNMQNVYEADGMLDDCGMSTANYDDTLVGWEAQPLLSGVDLGAQNLTYTSAGAGGAARNSIITNYSWNISGDSPV